MQTTQLTDRQRFLRFAVVGVSGTIIDFSIFNLLSVAIGLPVIFSSVASFIIAVINNFIWNRVWTYPESKEMDLSGQLVKFSVVSVLGLLTRTPLFALIEEPVISLSERIFGETLPINPEIIGHNIALAFVIVVVLFWNYFINRKWTYKDIK